MLRARGRKEPVCMMMMWWRVLARGHSKAVTTLLVEHTKPFQKRNHLSYWEGPSTKFNRGKRGWSAKSVQSRGGLGMGAWHGGTPGMFGGWGMPWER